MEQILGQLLLFGGNFTIQGWAQCDGTLLPISQNTALFSLLGVAYGGNGQTTFALPDLRGRVVMGQGQGPGLTPHVLGEMSGQENATLIATNLPSHTHTLLANNAASTDNIPSSEVVLSQGLTSSGGPKALNSNIYSKAGPNTSLSSHSIAPTGNSQPFSVQQPYLVMNYMIAMQGIFPPRA